MSGTGGRGNADQARAATDAGETGDKVAFPDPAAAPLGTDAEAGGATTAPERLPATPAPRRPFGMTALVIAGLCALAGLVVVLVLFARNGA